MLECQFFLFLRKDAVPFRRRAFLCPCLRDGGHEPACVDGLDASEVVLCRVLMGMMVMMMGYYSATLIHRLAVSLFILAGLSVMAIW